MESIRGGGADKKTKQKKKTNKKTNSEVSGPIWPKFELVRDFMHVLVTCKYKKGSDQKTREKRWRRRFHIISQRGVSVAMETKVLIQSAPKPYAAFPPPQ